MKATGNGDGDACMLDVFRAQSPHGRLALLACWFVLVGSLALQWFRIGSAPFTATTPTWAELVRAVTMTIAVPLFARFQLSCCRTGHTLTMPWVHVALLLLSLGPLPFGAFSVTVFLACGALILAFRWTVWLPGCLAYLGGVTALVVHKFGASTATSGLIETTTFVVLVVASTRVAIDFDALACAREALARRHVDLERERVGRDLHDLMGRTLVAASLRTQTAVRTLGDRDPEAARRLHRMHETISRGQVQLRTLTSGPAITTLEDELANARMLCDRVNVDLSVTVTEDPPARQDALVGTLVREHITRVLKHGLAATCALEIGREGDDTMLRVTTQDRQRSPQQPQGMGRLTRAVAAAGGTIDVQSPSSHTTAITCRLPIATGVRA